MTTQSELILEQNLLSQLAQNGYQNISIPDEDALVRNLKTQLEIHNNKTFSEGDFKQILNHLTRPINVFEKAKILRDKFAYRNDDNELVHIEFINMDHWCQNQYQVTSQISIEGEYKNRYDVTLLINGLPLIQIELKKRGLELKEAFNQVSRYNKHSFGAGHGLFQYIQIHVISNGVNTKYFAFSNKPDFKFTFYWTNEKNQRISNLDQFADTFLEKCHLSKMITRYTVLHESDKTLKVLRPYQFYAVEHIIERVKNSNKNGYIWHTTGSGKTLTSFKASQILSRMPKVDKVVFCVDRLDLDAQTSKEFNEFSPGCVDSTTDTKMLVKQFADKNTTLIVTTIQKLNTAISREHHKKIMDQWKTQKVVFIFDECHRSQFGETHDNIKSYFNNHQMFGFTGTPIFVENAFKSKGRSLTTKMVFEERLHEYVITDAIRDQNVLPFSVEYVGKYSYKDSSRNTLDIEVNDINTKELLESDDRIDKISRYIIRTQGTKTYNREYTAMFCISNVNTLIKYYDQFRKLKSEGEHDLKTATIFSYTANEDVKEETGDIPEDNLDFSNAKIDIHTRTVLDKYIAEYNKQFTTSYSTKDSKQFNDYYKDVARRVRNRDIDLLFVVNMFLTGFDSPSLNTLYVDKNLKNHGLLQAYSRTNRLKGDKKTQGNIVVFRNLKKATDDAIAIFSSLDAKEIIILKPYEDYVKEFVKALEKLYKIAPTVESVDKLNSEKQELEFVKAFRELMRIKNTMETYLDFTFDDLPVDQQTFVNYTSKYLDLYQKATTGTGAGKTSILDEVDFQLELIHRDDINVNYIIKLLATLMTGTREEKEKKEKAILDMVSSDVKLRSKRELIQKFISENLPMIQNLEIEDQFQEFMDAEKKIAFEKLAKEENVDSGKLAYLLESYQFSGRIPSKNEVVNTLNEPPPVLYRTSTANRLLQKFHDFIGKFVND